MTWINLADSNWIRRLSGPRPTPRAGNAAAAGGRSPRILVIDDDGVTRMTLGAALRSGGYEVEEVGDGGEGLAAFRRLPADLVITDLVMPHRGGLETVRELRATDPAVRIVVVSGVIGGSAEHLRAAVRLGADRVLPKPVDLGELLVMVGGLLSEPARG